MAVTLDPITPEILREYAELSEVEYLGKPVAQFEHLSWKFLENPQALSYGIHLREKGRLVGRIAYMPRTFACGAETLRGGYLVDLLLHPRIRSMQNLKLLVDSLEQFHGIDFLFVTPNHLSIPIYRHLLKMQEPLHLSAFAVPLRPGAVLRDKLPWCPASVCTFTDWSCLSIVNILNLPSLAGKLTFNDTIPGDRELANLIQNTFDSNLQCVGIRTEKFLRWRFAASPVNRYHFSAVYRNDRLLGYYAVREAKFGGLSTLFLVDCVIAHDASWAEKHQILQEIVRMAMCKNCDLVFGLFNFGVGKSSMLPLPVIPIPEYALPQTVPLFLKRFGKTELSCLEQKKWFISIADLDVF